MIATAASHGIEIKYHDMGEGDLILLVHGYGGGPSDWFDVAKELSKKYRVIVPNLNPLLIKKNEFTYSQQVNVMSDLITTHLPNSYLHIVGASYGGTLSFGLRAKAKHHFKSHLMFNPMPLHPVSSLKHIRLKLLLWMSRAPGVLQAFALSPLAKNVFAAIGDLFNMAGQKKLTHFNRRKFILVLNALSRFIWIDKMEDWSEWGKIKINDDVETTIFYSEKDQLFSQKTYSRLVEQFHQCQVYSLDNKKHMVIKTDPDIVSDLIDKAVSSSNKLL